MLLSEKKGLSFKYCFAFSSKKRPQPKPNMEKLSSAILRNQSDYCFLIVIVSRCTGVITFELGDAAFTSSIKGLTLALMAASCEKP